MDCWLDDKPLSNFLLRSISLPELYATVSEYWEVGHGWKWDKLKDLLPDTWNAKFSAVMLWDYNGCEDDRCWGLEPGGNFTIRSAYRITREEHERNEDDEWGKIWKLKIPNRIRMFIWLVKHKKILCNAERVRRNFTSNANCFFCAGQAEDVDHLFRKCKQARAIWERLLARSTFEWLDKLSWDAWMTANLQADHMRGFEDGWNREFAVTLWWLWRWRNENVFSNKVYDTEYKLHWINRQVKEIKTAFAHDMAPTTMCQYRMERVKWRKPQADWAKLNTDGSRNQVDGTARCGGIIRNENGDWVSGFSCRIGICPSANAEA